MNLFFGESTYHRHLRDQNETVSHQLTDCHTFALTIFFAPRAKGKSVSKIRGMFMILSSIVNVISTLWERERQN